MRRWKRLLQTSLANVPGGARMVASELRPESSVVAEVRPSPNHGERRGTDAPDTIVLHYTGMPDDQAAIRLLCNPSSEVSAHYVVLPDGYIIQLVAEARRAWHAGTSSWAGGERHQFALDWHRDRQSRP